MNNGLMSVTSNKNPTKNRLMCSGLIRLFSSSTLDTSAIPDNEKDTEDKTLKDIRQLAKRLKCPINKKQLKVRVSYDESREGGRKVSEVHLYSVHEDGRTVVSYPVVEGVPRLRSVDVRIESK